MVPPIAPTLPPASEASRSTLPSGHTSTARRTSREASRASAWLQTSPYLSTLEPGQDSPLVYLSDTAGPAYPVGDEPPADAAFGVVGLDRTIVWESDAEMRALLREASLVPQTASALRRRFGADRVAAAVARGWLQKPEDLCREYRLVSGEIEVTAHCNWGCRFCPVATDPKPPRTMPMALFEDIVAKLAGERVDYVTFQFFNEPTLDKHFVERLEVLAEHELQLALYSNASALTPAKGDELVRLGVLRHLIVNLPSVDEAEFGELTGSRSYGHTMRNTEAAIAAGLPVQIVVNGVGERLAKNLAGVQDRFGPMGAEVYPSLTCDRAGDVGGEYAQDVYAAGRLTGCGWPVQHVNVSVTGHLFLCCNDYYQREVFGHISDGTIAELMTSEQAIALRRKVFGVDASPADFLCRRCHNQQPDFPGRDFRPIATFG
ncbi:radical SAM/SPASM domain-containing protein [Streptomyces sp. NPDC048330]|uniref:radical SAM/SPASM domain-containing protein n=1 Tax=Streptomyces sp. NPDC048330 TaxID=3365533 RepID=UPI00370FD19C